MKKDILYLFAFILVVQLIVPTYSVQLIIWVLVGFIVAFKFRVKSVFWKSFVCQLIVGLLLLLFLSGEVTFMENLANELHFPYLIIPTLFLLINALTVALSFQIGQSVKVLIKK